MLCVLGNVATLATGVRARLGARDAPRLSLPAHHAHLSAPDDPCDEAAGWLDRAPLTELTDVLGDVRAMPRDFLDELGTRRPELGPGRRLPGMLRRRGLREVRVRAATHVFQHTDPYQPLLIGRAELRRSALTERDLAWGTRRPTREQAHA
ncbi:hypothetical protein [Streptomyces violaceusniger]|uniref:hypothetical protein n=1 Tax=Streptomyces violaceusniger TaxID=68280 RepID=UPI0009C1EE03|nr:hypothetical protein [Streptomyces hygroscopicus]AQW46556.1 hypothetical protein SHXM_00019 [Streptomyces hygroscopicus]